MITLIQFAGQNVSPENDASVYNALARGANSCLTPIQANINSQGNIAFTDGYMIIQGRVVHLESHTIVPTLPESGTATGKIYIEIDITNSEAPCQIKTTVGTFAPVQGDINLGGTLYQLIIGTYTATASEISAGSVDMTLPNSADATFELGYKDEATGRIKMAGSTTGAYFHIYDKGNNGKLRANLQTTSDSTIFILREQGGRDKFNASGGSNGGQLYLKHASYLGDTANAVELGSRGTGTDSRGYLIITDKNNQPAVIFDAKDGNEIRNKTKFVEAPTIPEVITSAEVSPDGYADGVRFSAGGAIPGFINLGQTVARVAYDKDGGRLIIYNRNGDERIRMGITGSGAGKIEILDADGNSHRVLTE